MPMQCTSCQAQIAATLDTDVATLRGENERLTGALGTAQAQADGHQALVDQNAQLTAQLATRDEQDTRVAAMREHGADPSHLDDLQRSWQAANVGKAEADRQDWGTYLETAKTHPLYKHAFGAAAGAGAAGAAGAAAAGAAGGAGGAAAGAAGGAGAGAAGGAGGAGGGAPRPAAGASAGGPQPPNIAAVVQSFSNTAPAPPTEQLYQRADVAAYVETSEFAALPKVDKLGQLKQMERSLERWESQDGAPSQF